jgi:hypothetical protein
MSLLLIGHAKSIRTSGDGLRRSFSERCRGARSNLVATQSLDVSWATGTVEPLLSLPVLRNNQRAEYRYPRRRLVRCTRPRIFLTTH